MRSIIPARFCNAGDLASFGIHPMVEPEFDLADPDLGDTVDLAGLDAVNKSLALHGAEVEDFAPRRSYRMNDYLPVAPKPTRPARAQRRRLAA